MIIKGKVPEHDLEILNRRLKEHYGTTGDKSNFRIVWSDDQYEMRISEFTPEGLQLITPKIQQFPKYIKWVKERYILERLVFINEIVLDMPVGKFSYEPLYVFESNKGEALAPIWPASKFLVETVLIAIEQRGNYTKYKMPYSNEKEYIEQQKKELDELEKQLFGELQSDIPDALHYKEAIIVPANFNKE